MKARFAAVLSLTVLLAAAGFAASPRRTKTTTSYEGGKRSGSDWVGGDAISDFSRHTRVDSGRSHRNLTLFPVVAPGVRRPNVDLPLDKAVAMGLIGISELEESEVNRLRVKNKAKSPVFVMAGEMLRGGKQDRIVGSDLVLPPGADLIIPVFCVEHGRWSGAGGGFSAGHSLAGSDIRGAAGGGGRAGGGQSAVWSKVAEQQQRLRAPSPTGALKSVHDSAEVRDRMKPYLHALTDLAEDNPKACGIVAVIDDEILTADLFSSPALFQQIWPQLLESYIIDALDREEGEDHHVREKDSHHSLNATFVQRWLNKVGSATRKPKDTPGSGMLYELRGSELVGSTLVLDKGVVHMELFPEYPVKPIEYNSLEFRRDRLRVE